MGTGWRPAPLSGSGQGHPHSAATLPSEDPGGLGGGAHPRTHKAADSLDAGAVRTGPELFTLPAGISCHLDLGEVGAVRLLGRANLGTHRAHTGPAGSPLCLPTLANPYECEMLTSVSPLTPPSRLQQVWDRCSWAGVVTGFQVLRVFGPSLSPQGLCSLAPGVLRPWVWTQEGDVCVQHGDAPSPAGASALQPCQPLHPLLGPGDDPQLSHSNTVTADPSAYKPRRHPVDLGHPGWCGPAEHQERGRRDPCRAHRPVTPQTRDPTDPVTPQTP